MLLAASILLSRVLGYVREAVLAWQLGATAEVDAYRAAFQIPDLLNYGAEGLALAGAVSITVNALITVLLARALHGGPPLYALAASAVRAGLIAAPAGFAASWAEALPSTALARLVAGLIAFSAVALPAVWFFGDEPLRHVLRRLRRRLTRWGTRNSATPSGPA